MTLKTATIFITALAFGATLMIIPFPVASGQVGKQTSKPQFLQQAKNPDDLLKDALALSATKDRESGRLRLLDAVEIWLKMGEPEKAARACLLMGDSYRQAKRYQDSLYYYKLSLEKGPPSGAFKAMAFNSIAQVYAELYHSDLALHYYSKAGDQVGLPEDAPARLVTLTGLADLYYQQGQIEKAIACVRQARQLNRKLKNEHAEAALLHLIGRVAQEEGALEKARGAFERALIIRRETSNVAGEVKILCSISKLYLSSDQKQMALSQAAKAVELAEKEAERAVSNADILRARELQWPAWFSLARAQRAVSQNELAGKSFRKAITHVEGLWWSAYIATENCAVRFREELQSLYREFVDLLVEQKQVIQAFDWAEHARAHATMGLIKARRMTGLPKNGEQDKTARELSGTIDRLRTQLLSPRIGKQQRDKIENEVRGLEYRLEETRVSAEMERARERLVWSQRATIKQLQEKMLRDKDALIGFFLGEARSSAWLVSPKDVYLAILPGRKEVEKEVRQYLEVLTTVPSGIHIDRDISGLKVRAERLYRILFGQLSERIVPGQKLIVVPDGLLNYLPFETLMHDGRYAIQDHEISYLTSSSMLGIWGEAENKTETTEKMELLAFGDPIFGPEQNESVYRRSKTHHGYAANRTRTFQGFQLTPLPMTRHEVHHIASLFPPERRQVYTDKDSTEEVVKRESLRRYRRLHFATHSLVSETSPSRSAVVLTLDDDPNEDGLLGVSEISELDLDCELVVLSACQTGHGQLLSGEGIQGLSRAFIYAGAQSVVVSLWNVNDTSTAELMKSFYQHLASNSSNAAALRQAKLRMLGSSAEMRHPYYWAAFVIIGKP